MATHQYGDLISFEAVEDIIKLKESGEKAIAKNLVSSYVVSEAMGAKLTHRISPNLDLNNPSSPKGVQIVGNYGTGKSHLLAVIGAIAEHDDLHLEKCDDPSVDAAMDCFRGQFEVVRLTIGATFKSFRDIIFSSLQDDLKSRGVSFDVPPMDAVNENATVMAGMMDAFTKKFPDKGLLIIVDELLDYLRSQDNQAQFAAINFLREIGEFCSQSNFRFIAGLQASLFGDSGLVADPDLAKNLARVKDRFETLVIERTDIQIVVSRRMLMKTDEQKAHIRSYLQQFTETFENLERDMDTFVEVWPVHPKFLEIFHKIQISQEKRQVFKAVADFIKPRLKEKVPSDRPGLLTYDLHWQTIAGETALEANAEVKEVKNAMVTIESRIDQTMDEWQKKTSRKLVRGLAIHRFTTPNIKVSAGLTANDLRLELFPYIPKLPKKDPERMTEMIVGLLNSVQKACLGELLNEKDGQWFLDLDLTQNWYHLVEEHRAQLSEPDKDRYFFNVIRQVVLGNIERETDVSNHQIFSHELEWIGHGVTRPGWLFFGTPDERPTAKPPKDYYVYVLPPWKPAKYTDEKKKDEIFIHFKGKSIKEFQKHLETYASARFLMMRHSHGRQALKTIAEDSFKDLVKWMDASFAEMTEVRWHGTSKKFTEWTDEAKTGTVDQRFCAVASHLLNPNFADQYPTYPRFNVASPITQESRVEMASIAVKAIANSKLDDTSKRILDGLGMVKGNDIEISSSKYIQRIENILGKKKVGEVTNFEELSDKRNERYFSKPDKLEPEWLVVLLSGLIHRGSATITYPAIGTINVDRIGDLVHRKGEKFWSFTHVGKPKGLDIAALKAICRLLSIAPGKVSEDEAKLKVVTTSIREKARDKVESILELHQWLSSSPELWSMSIVEDADNQGDQLEKYKTFLDGLQVYDKPAKWANLKMSVAEIEVFSDTKMLESDLQDRRKAKDRLEKSVGLLSRCENSMPSAHDWTHSLQETKDALRDLWSSPTPFPSGNVQNVATLVNKALASYRKCYLESHKQYRLDINLDKQKKALLEDDRISTLRRIATLKTINEASLDAVLDRLASLQTCWRLEEKDLKSNDVCPHCGFTLATPDPPSPISATDLDDIGEQLDRMEKKWVKDMLAQLKDPAIDRSVLKTAELAPLEEFEKAQAFPMDTDTLSRFVASADKAFSGLTRVVITTKDLVKSIVGDGEALTPNQLKSCVSDLIDDVTKGLDPAKVRIVVKDEVDDD